MLAISELVSRCRLLELSLENLRSDEQPQRSGWRFAKRVPFRGRRRRRRWLQIVVRSLARPLTSRRFGRRRHLLGAVASQRRDVECQIRPVSRADFAGAGQFRQLDSAGCADSNSSGSKACKLQRDTNSGERKSLNNNLVGLCQRLGSDRLHLFRAAAACCWPSQPDCSRHVQSRTAAAAAAGGGRFSGLTIKFGALIVHSKRELNVVALGCGVMLLRAWRPRRTRIERPSRSIRFVRASGAQIELHWLFVGPSKASSVLERATNERIA